MERRFTIFLFLSCVARESPPVSNSVRQHVLLFHKTPLDFTAKKLVSLLYIVAIICSHKRTMVPCRAGPGFTVTGQTPRASACYRMFVTREAK